MRRGWIPIAPSLPGIALMWTAAVMAGQPSPVGSDVRGSVEAWAEPVVSRDRTMLPTGIATLCADSAGRLAAPGAKWESTDSGQEAELPRARLIWFTRSGTRVLVHFETGGRAHGFHLMEVALSNSSQPTVMWRAYAPYELRDFAALLRALREDRILDDPS